MASKEYFEYINSRIWKDKSASFQSKTAGRCSLLPWLRANDSHHLTYDNFKNESFLRDCIPVSRFAHNLIHKSPIGSYFWNDIRWRRRWMNFFLRVIAIVVTIATAILIPVFRICFPNYQLKPKLRKR